MNTPKIRVLSVFFFLAVCGALFIPFFAVGLGSALGGGQIAIASPSAEIDADSVGDVIVGNGNVMQRPYTPESPVHVAGEWLGAGFWGVMFVASVGGMAMMYLKRDEIMQRLLEPPYQVIMIQAPAKQLKQLESKIK